MNELKDNLIASFQDLFASAVEALPRILTGIALLIVAVLFCKLVERVLRLLLRRIKIDDLMKKTGIDKTLSRAGIRQELNQFVPRLVYFLLLFLMAKTLADALGLVAVSDALGAFFTYLPNLVAALLLLVLGSAAAQFAGNTVTQAARGAGIDFAPALGRIVGGMILFIISMMAIGQLQLDTDIIRIVTSVFLAGVALAFGLSMGFGTRDITRKLLAGFYARKVLRLGETTEVDGVSGRLRAITATHTILEDGDGGTVAVSNDTVLDQVSRQRPAD